METCSPLLSYITHFYNNIEQARRIAKYLSEIQRDLTRMIEFIFVDDGSLHSERIDFGCLTAKYIRIDDNIPWNQPGARNLGYHLSIGSHVFFTDIDHTIDAASTSDLLKSLPSLRSNVMYKFKRRQVGQSELIHSHVNTFVMERSAFRVAGGYDLEFAGSYGHDDTAFEKAWKSMGGSVEELPINVTYFPGRHTVGLNRATERNTALLSAKIAKGFQPKMDFRLPDVKWRFIS